MLTLAPKQSRLEPAGFCSAKLPDCKGACQVWKTKASPKASTDRKSRVPLLDKSYELFENQESPAFSPILETSHHSTHVICGCKMVEIFACTTLFMNPGPPAFAIMKTMLPSFSLRTVCRFVEIDDFVEKQPINPWDRGILLSVPYRAEHSDKHVSLIDCAAHPTAPWSDRYRPEGWFCLPSSLAFRQTPTRLQTPLCPRCRHEL